MEAVAEQLHKQENIDVNAIFKLMFPDEEMNHSPLDKKKKVNERIDAQLISLFEKLEVKSSTNFSLVVKQSSIANSGSCRKLKEQVMT